MRMKIVKAVILWCLMLLALSVCGTAVLWVMSKLVAVSFANIFYSGFKIGFVASVLLLCFCLIRNRKTKKNLDN